LQVIRERKIINPKEVFLSDTQSIVSLATHFKNIILDTNLIALDIEFHLLKNTLEIKKLINEDTS
jgi:hypothetical protein